MNSCHCTDATDALVNPHETVGIEDFNDVRIVSYVLWFCILYQDVYSSEDDNIQVTVSNEELHPEK